MQADRGGSGCCIWLIHTRHFWRVIFLSISGHVFLIHACRPSFIRRISSHEMPIHCTTSASAWHSCHADSGRSGGGPLSCLGSFLFDRFISAHWCFHCVSCDNACLCRLRHSLIAGLPTSVRSRDVIGSILKSPVQCRFIIPIFPAGLIIKAGMLCSV